MRWVSCQKLDSRVYTFEEAVLCGWAEDGGMIMPERVAKVDSSTLEAWRGLSYKELSVQVLGHFIGDEIGTSNLRTIVYSAARSFNPAAEDVVKLYTSKKFQGLKIVELWHGPTLAFKDIGLQILCSLLSYFLERKSKSARVVLLIGTSGDTGSAAIEAVRGLHNIQIVILYPHGRDKNGNLRITDGQRLQMTTVDDWNVHCVGVDGSSDDLDFVLESVFRDLEFVNRYSLGSVNSINIGRILVQATHLVWAYLQEPRDKEVVVSIPTGAAGHVTAAMLAQQMGVPFKVHLATNRNDVLSIFLRTGSMDANRSPVTVSKANAMDIQIPYNIERLLHIATNGEKPRQVREWIQTLKGTGRLTVTEEVVTFFEASNISTGVSSDDAILRTIKTLWEHERYLIDPHTAVGVHEALRLLSAARRVVIAQATAHPSKFPDTVSQAVTGLHFKSEEYPDKAHPFVARLLKLLMDYDGPEPPIEHNKIYKSGKNWASNWESQLRELIENLRWPLTKSQL